MSTQLFVGKTPLNYWVWVLQHAHPFGQANFQCHQPESGEVLFATKVTPVTMADEAKELFVHLLRDQDTIDLNRFSSILGQDILTASSPCPSMPGGNMVSLTKPRGIISCLKTGECAQILALVENSSNKRKIARRWQLSLDVPGLMTWILGPNQDYAKVFFLKDLDDAFFSL